MRTARHDGIRRLLLARGFASVDAIGKATGASLATIRRDLDRLEAEGVVKRVHGGARLAAQSMVEAAFDKREEEGLAAKRAIGRSASLLIAPNSTNFLDSGTTVLQLARAMRVAQTPCAVHTNGLPIAQALIAADSIAVWMLGGRMRRENLSLVGPAAEAMIEALWFDNLFMGAVSIAPDGIIYGVDEAEARLNARMMTRAARLFILADASKFGRTSFFAIGALGPGVTLSPTRRSPRHGATSWPRLA